ncbi:uncharacterized protein [Cherax quadricarinatus]
MEWWAWAPLIIGAWAQGTTMYVASGIPTQCVSQQHQNNTYSVSFSVQCAVLSNLLGAVTHTFDDINSCTLVGEGMMSTKSEVTYSSFPALETLQEVARGKNTFGSPYYGEWVPSLAVDGIELDSSMSHSDNGVVRPWWLVDLGTTHTLHEVLILSRRDQFSVRLHNVEIRVGNTFINNSDYTSYVLFSTYLGPYQINDGYLSCRRADGIVGRYVSIQRVTPEDDMLQLVEVKVMVKII